MLVLATILSNPGEPKVETRYSDPQQLRALGYTDLAIYPTTGLSGLTGPETVQKPDMIRWVNEQYDAIQNTAEDARAVGMGIWLTCDAPSLAMPAVNSAMTCTRSRQTLCPASQELKEACGRAAEALMARFDPIAGLILRLGDNDAHRLPYLLGNDLYTPHCARCNALSPADRLTQWIQFFYDLVVKRLGKRLIVRAWNVKPGGLHDTPELCRNIIERLPDDQRLIWSFKFPQTDFWRYQQWNPSSLCCGDRPVIYELQCQREYEGKGAIPNYQPPLWSAGMPETPEAQGLKDICGKINLAGLWGWVRGGGWGGPFVSREWWIDANVFAIPKLAADPQKEPKILARDWICQQLGYDDTLAIDTLMALLAESPQIALETFYIGPYAAKRTNGWHPSGNFIQDDQIDPEAAWRIIRQLDESELENVIAEKQRAIERTAKHRRALQQAINTHHRPPGEELIHTLEYAESIIDVIRHLVTALVHRRRYDLHRDPAMAQNAINQLLATQHAWNHHTQRIASLRGTATAFQSDNLWTFTQQMIDELHEKLND